MGRILIIRGGAIGDFILTLPVCAALRRQFPGNHLEVLGYAHIARLALLGGQADAVRSIEARPLAGFFARGGTLDPEWSDYFSGFHLILSYLYDPDAIFQENVARCSKAQFLAGPHRPSEQDAIHATDVFLKPLERLAIFDADPVPALKACAVEQEQTLALHPGSGSERKNWPESRWAELMERLMQTTGLMLLAVGGEAEGDRLQRLAARLPKARIELAHCLPLPELAARLARCAAFVGHDSGITHLAAALGLPALALWGESAEAVWRPRGERITVLRHEEGLTALPVERVAEEIGRMMA